MRIAIYTCAYNAEHTLQRTAKSIFAQTISNWTWYLLDNGSTDRTGKMIRGYAKRDKRIIPLANKKNYVWEPGNTLTEVIKGYDDSDCFCWIDADDAYKPNFLEKSLAFMVTNHLDIAACGYDFVDAKTKALIAVRKPDQNVFLEGQEFQTCFPIYHQFMRTYWAKLFSVSVWRHHDSTHIPTVSYGWDTLFTMETFRNAPRVGILAESLYKYYVSPKSISYKWNMKRIEADRILREATYDFLLAKCGFVSPRNEEFLLLIYMSALYDTTNVLLHSEIPESEKIAGVIDIFLHRYSKQLAARECLGALSFDRQSVAECTRQRKEMFSSVAQWLLSREEVPDEQFVQYCDVGELTCAVAENAEGWLFFKKLRIRFWVKHGHTDEARTEVAELAELLPSDREIAALRSQFL